MQETLDTISFIGGLLFGVALLICFLVLVVGWIIVKMLDRLGRGLDTKVEPAITNQFPRLTRGIHDDNL